MEQTRDSRVARLVQGLIEGGFSVRPGFRARNQPMEIDVDGVPYRVFSWQITPRGKTRSLEEYRVQATRPDDTALFDPDQRTLLLGYHDELDTFAAWDARMHPDPSSSASLQVPLAVLQRAATEGFFAHPREIGSETEVVVAFRPEAAITYLEAAPQLPVSGASEADVAALVRAGSGEPVPVDELPEGIERQREIRIVEEKVRDQRFRVQVLAAYEGRCAFCGLAAGITQAAHIEGVGEGGPDLVVNGLGVCPNHHASFDRGLITVAADNAIEFNDERLQDLGYDRNDVKGLWAGLFERLVLPRADANHPDPARLAAHRERWR